MRDRSSDVIASASDTCEVRFSTKFYAIDTIKKAAYRLSGECSIDFTVDALDFKNVTLLKQFVTDQGRILPRKYTGLPAHYQRRLNRSIKRARQMLLMK